MTHSNEGMIGVSVGGALHFVHESAYVKELAPMGIRSVIGFRRLCKGLKVPLVRTSGGVFVEVSAFNLAMRAISRVGRPDFNIRQGDELDMKYLRDNYENLAAEMFFGQKHMKNVHEEMRQNVRETARRMHRYIGLACPPRAQINYNREQVESLRRELGHGELKMWQESDRSGSSDSSTDAATKLLHEGTTNGTEKSPD